MSAPARLALVGAGNRGRVYAGFLRRYPDVGTLIAVAEPDPARRARLASAHGIALDARYARWQELLAAAPELDGLIIATPDALHLAPALAALERGYPILLEKPVAPTRAEVLALAAAAQRLKGRVTVAHVLRYTPFFQKLKALVDEGAIGSLMSVAHLENVAYWHFAHSFVRGNWRRQDQASPMLLAKACHDLDLLRWLVGAPCKRVASFGHLSHFRPEQAPAGAAPRCLDCAVERLCPYSAVRFYLETHADNHGWPVSVLGDDSSSEGRWRSLRNGPYGRCVYACDNDVCDHQVVALEFASGVTATLTVSAFTGENTRTFKLMGSLGELRGHLDRGEIELRRFVDDSREIFSVEAGGGHAGGDDGLMAAFVASLSADRGESEAPTALAQAIDSHLIAFAAERARNEGLVVAVDANEES